MIYKREDGRKVAGECFRSSGEVVLGVESMCGEYSGFTRDIGNKEKCWCGELKSNISTIHKPGLDGIELATDRDLFSLKSDNCIWCLSQARFLMH